MTASRRVCRLLDEEHQATLALLARVQRAARGGAAPGDDASLAAWRTLAAPLAHALEHEIERHFVFEEQQLFPRLHEGGAGDLATLLLEEHGVLRTVAADLMPRVRQLAADEALDAAAAAALHRTALEWAERLESHIHKETAALLPAVEDLLDDAADGELAMDYAAA